MNVVLVARRIAVLVATYGGSMVRSAKGTSERPGRTVRQKAGLNREIHRSAWGMLASRLEDKAPGRVEKVNPAYTSQRCSA